MYDDLLKHWTSGVQRSLDPDEEAARQMIANSAAGSSAANRFVSLLPPMAGGRPSPAPVPDARQALTRMVGEPSAVSGMMGGAEYGSQPELGIGAFTGGFGGGVMSGVRQARQGAGALPASTYQGNPNVTISPEANGSRPYDMFNTGLPQNPFYMGERPEAIHTLGVSGFRTGSSRPVYDDGAGQAWDQRSRQNFMIQDMLGRQDIARGNQNFMIQDMLGRQDIARGNQNIDLQRLMLQSQDRQDAIQQRRQAEWDRILQKTPPGMRGPVIDQGEIDKNVSPEVAKDMRVDDVFSVASRAAGGMNQETGRPNKLEDFMRVVGQNYDPKKHDKFSIIRKLEGMGIHPNTIRDLRGKGFDPFLNSILGKDVEHRFPRGASILGDLFEDIGITDFIRPQPKASSALQRLAETMPR